MAAVAGERLVRRVTVYGVVGAAIGAVAGALSAHWYASWATSGEGIPPDLPPLLVRTATTAGAICGGTLGYFVARAIARDAAEGKPGWRRVWDCRILLCGPGAFLGYSAGLFLGVFLFVGGSSGDWQPDLAVHALALGAAAIGAALAWFLGTELGAAAAERHRRAALARASGQRRTSLTLPSARSLALGLMLVGGGLLALLTSGLLRVLGLVLMLPAMFAWRSAFRRRGDEGPGRRG